MKSFKLLFPLLLILTVFSCEKNVEAPLTEETFEDAESFQKAIRSGRPGYYVFPFDATGKTSGADVPENVSGCQGPFADQRGEGNLFKLGDFQVRFTFCVDPSTVPQGFFNYSDALATFYLKNGDEIYAKGEGTVFLLDPTQNPAAFFKDTFYFTGAKIDGKMKAAKGFFRTDSEIFNPFTPNEFTAHKFKGLLKIKS